MSEIKNSLSLFLSLSQENSFLCFFCCRENIGSPKRRIYKSSLQENTTEIHNSEYLPRESKSIDLLRLRETYRYFCIAEITTRTTTTTRSRTEAEKSAVGESVT